MSTIEHTVQRPLTPVEIARVIQEIDGAATIQDAFANSLIAIFDSLLRDVGETWDSMDILRPADYAIPRAQSVQITEHLLVRCRELDPISSVNVLLDWMNVGPSTYETEAG